VIVDATHRRWIIVCLALFAIAAVAYVPYRRTAVDGPRGGSWPGLTYGVAGLALMIYAGVLGLRRKVPTWRLGRATTWMKGHLWLGLLSFPLIWLHAGFHLGGPLTLVLMVLFTVVVLSGIFGVVLQQFVPRLMMVEVPYETIYEQIDSVVAQLAAEAAALVASACGPLPVTVPAMSEGPRGGGGLLAGQLTPRPTPRPLPPSAEPLPGSKMLKDLYLTDIQAFLETNLPRDGRLVTPAHAKLLFQQLRMSLLPPLQDTVNQLEAICEERWQLARQKRLHHLLHGWLLVHVPLSAALLLLAVAHAVIALRY
jgi:hypothetical protein